ncbi:TPA: hypothetical protein SL675_003893 [Pseudomonas aeruginosa]|uniref:hypothetical protein n=1 Tax=Pseudomonas aeruginosa TaxID=287 RepID=UPI00071BB9F9|nr:hypothetical protein [Pseudomonas aeruginosa]KSP22718.1 hypothetical protein APB10_19490 [Pseudomonas aeruginosa]MDY1279601.1 hypothetical protein [Pseudomonas aeruginosa]ONM82087.1 hypothetical protein B0B23_29030 [Pseudomonas aeruginosa]ONM95881.1 hypothetical protein B0B22_07220 [Pseudomonas aeruginosa]HEJ1634677.1 hypothetical protein [Pseudomonas aeruginosa]
MTVQPISDEQLAEVERLISQREPSYENRKIMNATISAIIARLRAAEVDAKRWRHARDILTVEAIESAQSDFINFGLPPDESESIRADQAIDSAMESTP